MMCEVTRELVPTIPSCFGKRRIPRYSTDSQRLDKFVVQDKGTDFVEHLTLSDVNGNM